MMELLDKVTELGDHVDEFEGHHTELLSLMISIGLILTKAAMRRLSKAGYPSDNRMSESNISITPR